MHYNDDFMKRMIKVLSITKYLTNAVNYKTNFVNYWNLEQKFKYYLLVLIIA